ncbi:MAG TPA: FkbM family methyltransferase, partial [Vicinamibacterales bacterium]
ECLHHADAVVALNTSAELEAGIAGRPVFTVLANDRSADGQAHTLHFNYLLREHGGFVTYAANLEEHVAQLGAQLREPMEGRHIQEFVKQFLRPCGDGPVSSLLAQLLVERAVPRSAHPSPEVLAPSLASPSPIVNDGHAPAHHASAPARLLRLTSDSSASIFATPETRRWRRDGVVVMAPGVRAWLEAQVRPGDTLYEVGAGVGVYAIFAAVHRGCTAVAFEPGFAAFKALCDNVVHNGCGRSVLPLPVALGPRTGLLELEYSHDAGSDQHSLTDRPWRAARDGSDVKYVQPVCAETLDEVVRRHALPPPTAIRIAVRRQPQRVLQGAAAVLALPGLRTVLCSVRSLEQAQALEALIEPLGFNGGEAAEDGDHGVSVVFTRVAPAQGRGGPLRRLGALFGTPDATA